jgi:hypothetical protein
VNKTTGNKYAATYRHSIFIVHHGRQYLEAVYDNPKGLKRALGMMRQRNPKREYATDDPENP